MEPISRTVETWDKVKLFTQVNERSSGCWLIATHGIGEHLGRHEYIHQIFGNDVNTLQYDLRGHGKSGGNKAHVDDFEYYVKDLESMITYLRDKYGAKRVILFGHSMGALITLGLLQNNKTHNDILEGAIVNAPPMGFPGALGKIVGLLNSNMTKKLAGIEPSIPLGGLVDLNYLSHDKTVRQDYEVDPLNHLKVHTRLIFQIVNYSKMVGAKPINSSCDLFCSYGSEDRIVAVGPLEKYFTDVEKNTPLKCFEGAYHELHLETDRYRIPYFDYLKGLVDQMVYKKELKENA